MDQLFYEIPTDFRLVFVFTIIFINNISFLILWYT